MNCLTININFSEEACARLDRLTAALEVIAAAMYDESLKRCPTVAVDPDQEAKVEAPAEEHPVTDPFPTPAPEAAAPAPAPISLAEFQKELTLCCAESAEKKDRVRALINEYAPAASAVPEDKRAEILARLAGL